MEQQTSSGSLSTLRVDPHSSLPIAAQLSSQLRWQIASGGLRPDDELPSLHEAAADLGVNYHTVRASYQQLAEQGLIELSRGRRARVVGFDRGTAARAASPRSFSIGVIVPAFREFYAGLVEGIEGEAAEHSTMVYVANAHENSDTALLYLDQFLARGVDGVVVASLQFGPDVVLPRTGPPVVFIDAPGASGITIDFDLEGSQHLATSHLVAHGHRRIGFVTPPTALPNVKPKLAGHRRALQEAGITVDDSLISEVDDFTVASGFKGGMHLLDRDDPPSAITTTTDVLGAGVVRAARQLDLHIPEDLAITSNDNSEIAALVDPPLTTVTLPLRDAGRIAVQRILEHRPDRRPAPTTLDVELVINESCGGELS